MTATASSAVYDDIHNSLASLDGGNVVLDFVDPDGSGAQPMTLAKRYLYGQAVDQILAQEDLTKTLGDTSRTLWPLVDNLGTVRDLAKQDGTIAVHYVYDTFGNVISGDTSQTRYLFTSREFDTDTELQYNRARWYDPEVGRWISQDPIGFLAGDANEQRYVGNAVSRSTDPSGFRRIFIAIRYHFKTLNLTPQIKAEVDRIFQDAMKRYGGAEHTLVILWIPVKSEADGKKYGDLGFWGGGWFQNNPKGVIVFLDDHFKLRKPGQGGHMAGTINPGFITDVLRDAGRTKEFDRAVGATIAHELGLHAIGAVHGYHYVKKGFVDATSGGQIGGVFSDKAAHNLVDQLDAEEGDP